MRSALLILLALLTSCSAEPTAPPAAVETPQSPPASDRGCWLVQHVQLEPGVVVNVHAHFTPCPDPLPSGWERE